MSRPFFVLSLLLVLSLPAWSDTPAKAQPSSVERLIKQLGSNDFAEREAASRKLEEIGEPALEALQKAAAESSDGEVRRRAKQVVESVEARMYGELRCFKGHTDFVYRVAFSPDGKLALSGSADETMRLWEVDTGKELRRFEGHTDLVYGVAFSPDGKQVLSGSKDKTVGLWHAQTGKELRRFHGHDAAVFCVAFSPDGKRVFSASHDQTVRQWDTQTGKQVHCFTGHTSRVVGLASSPDGKLILSGSHDKSLSG
jgi:WD40 repeat protein